MTPMNIYCNNFSDKIDHCSLPRLYTPVDEDTEISGKYSVSQNAYILEKFYTLTSPMAHSLLYNQSFMKEYPFRMSREELGIIENPSDMLLIGRSGTGKELSFLI